MTGAEATKLVERLRAGGMWREAIAERLGVTIHALDKWAQGLNDPRDVVARNLKKLAEKAWKGAK